MKRRDKLPASAIVVFRHFPLKVFGQIPTPQFRVNLPQKVFCFKWFSIGRFRIKQI